MPILVDAEDLRHAFTFVSMAAPSENSAYICCDTGRIYLRSLIADTVEEDELPADIETSDRYIAIPHKTELDLGRRLALAFIGEALPARLDTAIDMFRRRGAYGRFKSLLEAHDLLPQWYAYEEQATEAALQAWCGDTDILPRPAQPSDEQAKLTP